MITQNGNPYAATNGVYYLIGCQCLLDKGEPTLEDFSFKYARDPARENIND